ncbi:CD63 antigen [Ictalurus furcatus]|uniref:CD63 antigen n=1 Tax=Ictalurus furcatus TaxID=66913 RepID=UPI0023501882|nr:CD63 antigen [Ictalurus furcatus]
MEGAMKCVKFLFFFFNFIFWLCGLALIIVGVLARTAITRIPAIQEVASTGSPILIIVVGAVIFLIAFFGCCGAWKDNYCMVTTFVVLLSIIIIIEIGIAIGAYVLKGKLEDLPEKAVQEMMKNYTTNPDVQKDLDELQKELKCCGAVNASDWAFFKPDKNSVPDSCCKNISTNCGAGALKDANKIYTEGCGAALENLIKKNILWVGVAALVIAFIEILGVVFACTLMRGIRKGYEVM